MSEPFVFDPRCTLCKYPYGAVPCGAPVTLHVRPEGWEGFVRCTLLLRQEFSGQDREWELPAEGWDGERQRFSLTFPAPETPELCWYAFRFTRADGSVRYLDASGWCSEPQHRWQMTVYDAASPTPGWFGEGLTYQIFPDRFRRLSVPDPAGMIGGRWVHENWSDIPEWQPDSQGEVRNRDFFGGSLQGILSKLDDLAAFGVTTLYLNPIFESASNHRYNTADYLAIDPMLGTEADFRQLCREAKSRGIRVILDGVFNHTGSQSRYFNADGFYPAPGAAQSQDSPYFSWFSFHPWPTDYDAWWGIKTLPAVQENDSGYLDFIIRDQDSVVRHWLRAGASGWRLDVADELPDDFIADIRTAMDETAPGSLLLGEVWEDATTKVAYSQRRRYLLGQELHGVMNYPFRNALIAYLLGGDADKFRETLEAIRENYPPNAFSSLMNFLGTHDTPRILTVLGASHVPDSKEDRASYRLSPEERQMGLARLRLAALILFTFPGAPTVYYGDEAGMEGWEDPFNRAGYPWGREDTELKAWFARLARLRQDRPALQSGQLHWCWTAGPILAFARELNGQLLTTVINAADTPQSLTLPWSGAAPRDLLTGAVLSPADNVLPLTLLPHQGLLLES